ncbi:MogA/MoaB family molybdenum cofactor biosynthesis protein [Halalkalicoccus salilacus]|uniref:MogA/MoaB family molybdenum cofactor biosynthesis protein n=1 Tax=Halalkalicoccus salilacus TaxID=3117459 RepID=UPI00300F301F
MGENARHDDPKNEHERRHHRSDADGDREGHGGDHDHGPSPDHDHDVDLENPGAAVVTVSSSRSLDDDPSGDAIGEGLEAGGFEIATRELVNDDFDTIQHIVDTLTDRDDVDVVVTTGGTGVTPDDVTVEAVQPLISKTLPGFGELFRTLSYEEVGTRVVATRTIAGVIESVPVFCLPGSENAARLGCEEIIVEEAPHLIGLAARESSSSEE